MTRVEVYAKIKEYELQKSISEKYGWPYTNMSTATLVAEVLDYEETLKKVQPCPTTCNCKCTELIEMLYKKHILCKSEYEALMA